MCAHTHKTLGNRWLSAVCTSKQTNMCVYKHRWYLFLDHNNKNGRFLELKKEIEKKKMHFLLGIERIPSGTGAFSFSSQCESMHFIEEFLTKLSLVCRSCLSLQMIGRMRLVRYGLPQGTQGKCVDATRAKEKEKKYVEEEKRRRRRGNSDVVVDDNDDEHSERNERTNERGAKKTM